MTEGLIPSHGTARFNGPAGRPLTIVAEATPFLGHGHGSIAVLTDEDGQWYSAEVVYDGRIYTGPGKPDGAFIAYAVNGYEDRTTAERDALHRARLDG